MARSSCRLPRASALSAAALLWTVVAYAAPHDLDPTFGEGGVASVPVPPTTHPRGLTGTGVARQPDGRIVVVAESAGHDFLVQRFGANGAPDPTFGGDGAVSIDLGADDEPFAVAVQGDGRIVVAGTSRDATTLEPRAALVRLTSAGEPDASFGTAGKLVTSLGPGATAHALVLQPDGRILIAGGVGPRLFPAAYVARLTTSGALDPTFGVGGVATKAVSIFGDTAFALALQPDGAILAGGKTLAGGDFGGWFVLRFLSDGTLDASFGADGVVRTDVNGRGVVAEALDLVVQPDGRILAGGSTESVQIGLPSDFAIARYLADGTPDTTWGEDGLVVTTVLDESESGTTPATPVRALALQPDGRVLAIGGGALPTRSAMHLFVARYLDDGTLDPSWGEAGVARPDVALVDTLGLDAVLQPDGRLVIGARDGARIAALRLGGSRCAPTPATGCRSAERARLRIRNLGVATSLEWQWLRGAATSVSEIPAQSYTLCLYDASDAVQPRAGFATGDHVCGGGPCFNATPRLTRYSDVHGRGGPVRKLVLRPGVDLRSALRLAARGDSASLSILPLDGPVTVQLHAENGVCWGSTFDAPRRSDARFFIATE